MISLPSWTLSASNRATHIADVRQGAEHRGQVHSRMGNTGAFRRRLCLGVSPRRQQSPALPSHHLPPAPHTPPHHKSSCTVRTLCRERTAWWGLWGSVGTGGAANTRPAMAALTERPGGVPCSHPILQQTQVQNSSQHRWAGKASLPTPLRFPAAPSQALGMTSVTVVGPGVCWCADGRSCPLLVPTAGRALCKELQALTSCLRWSKVKVILA